MLQTFCLTIHYFPHIIVITLSGKLEIVFIAERKKEEIGSETGLSKVNKKSWSSSAKSSDHPNIGENR